MLFNFRGGQFSSRILLGAKYPMLAESIDALPLEDGESICSTYLITIKFERGRDGVEGLQTDKDVVAWMRFSLLCHVPCCSRLLSALRDLIVRSILPLRLLGQGVGCTSSF